MAFSKRSKSTVPSSVPMGAPGASNHPMQINMIGRGTTVSGEIRAKSDTSISGKVEGKLFIEGRLIITADGLIEGEIHATHADIGGRVNGDVHVQERLNLKGSCIVDGNIHTNKLVIEDGAVFTGKVVMGNTQPAVNPPNSGSIPSTQRPAPPPSPLGQNPKPAPMPKPGSNPIPKPAPNPIERRLSS